MLGRVPQMCTAAPCARNALAMPLPIPLDPPTTSTLLPVKSNVLIRSPRPKTAFSNALVRGLLGQSQCVPSTCENLRASGTVEVRHEHAGESVLRPPVTGRWSDSRGRARGNVCHIRRLERPRLKIPSEG